MRRKYCFYRMTDDSGFAPNPFHGYCTLAACTPNHGRADLNKDDVIVGVEADSLIRERQRKFRGESTNKRCIVYYMVVDERLTLNEYFEDPRFISKKLPQGKKETWSYEQKHGDNVYHTNRTGEWCWPPDHMHDNGGTDVAGVIEKDIWGNRVFVGTVYYYFGDTGVPLPENMLDKIPKKRGAKYYRGPLPEFDKYVCDQGVKLGKSGLIGNPIGRTAEAGERSSCGGCAPKAQIFSKSKCL